MRAIDIFRGLLTSNKKGLKTGIYSVCSAHETVIKASMQQARADRSILLIESTSNQVNQEGGYTGMQPRNFADFVAGIASEMSFDPDLILLGGDHLGPNTWQHLPAVDAMQKADKLVREYVKAGFQKIHLDASMFLADDRGDREKPLADKTVAARTARMCSAAEQAWWDFRKNSPRPIYIIGTEVPVPGGVRDNEAVKATRPQDAAKTIAVAKEAFYAHQLHSAWERVCGVVVQPGVEFGDNHVFDYQPEAALDLSREIENRSNFVYEAHSTDYQTPEALARLVRDHFCILKVGSGLTFAHREALFALAEIENHLLGSNPDRTSSLVDRLEKVMLEKSHYWEKYYTGSERQKALKRKFSYLDRCRYYWPDKELRAAQNKLYANLRQTGIPPMLISQYLPNQYLQIRQGRIANDPEALVLSKIREVLGVYSEACRLKDSIIRSQAD